MTTDPARPRILLVEDESTVRNHIAQTLSDEFSMETAGDGLEALKVLLRVRPDVIATDIVMPELNGIELLKTLRSTPSLRLIPVLLISGQAPDELRVEGFEQGADGYLAKPYTERELRARLRTMAQTARDRAEAARLEALEQAERDAMRALRESEAARTQSEIKQREAASRDALRVRLADALRPLHDPTDIQTVAIRILGEHLQALRVVYFTIAEDAQFATVEANYTASGKELLGRYRLDDFGPKWVDKVRQGEAITVNNVATDDRLDADARRTLVALDIGAQVLTPVMSEKMLVAALAVHDAQPRSWTAEEVALIQEFADRIAVALERVRSEARIREANRRKDEFLATLAHELRNPLAPMRNAAHVLKKPGLTEAQVRQAREIIERQIHHMVRLVDDLLDVSRINVGQVSLRHELLSLHTLINDAVEAVRSLIDDAGHTLEIQLPDEPVFLEGDGTRLVQVFQNLLNNAAKYTPGGGYIQVHAAVRGSEAVVGIRDNGLGIAAEAQDRIFELFTRVHPSDAIKVSGLGIGLSLARNLVELHNGRVEVRSEGANRGSEFLVYLPVLARPVEPKKAETTPERGSPRGLRVLVVDDNQDAAESLAMLLSGDGFETRVAFDGPHALEELVRHPSDLILLDIGMPGMDGYEVARRIRAMAGGSELVLCALTGWGQPEDKRRALQAGFDVHITKPVDPDTLADLLDSAARRGRP